MHKSAASITKSYSKEIVPVLGTIPTSSNKEEAYGHGGLVSNNDEKLDFSMHIESITRLGKMIMQLNQQTKRQMPHIH